MDHDASVTITVVRGRTARRPSYWFVFVYPCVYRFVCMSRFTNYMPNCSVWYVSVSMIAPLSIRYTTGIHKQNGNNADAGVAQRRKRERATTNAHSSTRFRKLRNSLINGMIFFPSVAYFLI